MSGLRDFEGLVMFAKVAEERRTFRIHREAIFSREGAWADPHRLASTGRWPVFRNADGSSSEGLGPR